MMQRLKNRLFTRTSILAVLCLLLFAAVLAPILHSGFYNDDVLNSLTFEAVHSSFHGSLIEMIKHYTYEWVVGAGRLFPLAFAFTYSTFYLLAWNPLYIKLVGLFGVLLVSLSEYRLVYILTDSKITALLTLLLLPITMQLRAGNDAILSYTPLLLVSLLFIFEQTIAFDRYCRTGRKSWLLLSLVLFVSGLLTYEISMAAILLNGIVVLKQRIKIKRALALLASHLVIISVYLGISLVLRQNTAHVYKGVEIGSLLGSLKSLLINLYASLPFSYWLSDPNKIFVSHPALSIETLIYYSLLGAFFIIIWTQVIRSAIERYEQSEISQDYQWSCIAGFVLVVFPAELMALSARYQKEINQFGLAHLPGTMESFGMAMIIASGCCWGIKKLLKKHWLWNGAVALGVLLSFTLCLNIANNKTVVAVQNRNFETWSRALFTGALRAGLMNAVPDGSVLIINRIPFWLQPELIPMFSGKHVSLESMANATMGLLNTDTASISKKQFFHVQWQRIHGGDDYRPHGLVSISTVKVLTDSSNDGLIKKRIVEGNLFILSNCSSLENIRPHISGRPVINGRIFHRQISMLAPYDNVIKSDSPWRHFGYPSYEFADLTISTSNIERWEKPVIGESSHEPHPFEMGGHNLETDHIMLAPYVKIGVPNQKLVGLGHYDDGECNGFRFDNVSNTGIQLSNFPLKMPFWISFWVKPTGIQLRYSTIISNHTDYRGVTLEQDGSTDLSSYNLGAGIGNQWIGGGHIKIEPDLWSLVVVGVTRDGIQIEVHNKVGTMHLNFSGNILLGKEPLHIGNWIGNDRAFNGSIADFEIFHGDIPKQLPVNIIKNKPCGEK